MTSLLGQKGRIGSAEIKNRLVMAPMGDLTANPDGTVSETTLAYYGARAKGGIGLIITGIVRINNTDGTAGPNQLSLADDSYIPGFKRLVNEVHKYGAKIFVQIQHSGRQGVATLTGKDYVLAPSAIPSAVMQQPTKALTKEEIKTLVGQFGDTAKRAMEAGADGVEIHGAHGYLINQFLSPFSNKRDDEYGGSFENRMRFLREIIQNVYEKTNRKIAVSVRLSVDEFLAEVGVTEKYIDLTEGVRIAKAVEAEGVDAINVSCGTYESMNFAIEPVSFPQNWRKGFIKAVKDEVSVPIIAVSKIREAEIAELLLKEEITDFVSIGRPLLSDPDFASKAIEARGDQIRKCISCLFCFDQLNKGSQVVCAVNPLTGFEAKYKDRAKTDNPKKVIVVGAGPAGLAAAEALVRHGHKVTVFEKAKAIGGQVRLGMNPPKKEQLGWFIDYYEKFLDASKIDIRLGQEADPEKVKAENPDAVLVAVGAKPIIPNVKGVDGQNVYTVEDVLCGAIDIKDKTIAVIGSGLTGLEVAELLQVEDNKTLIVEMQEEIAPGAYMQNLMDVTSRLHDEKTEYLTSHKLVKIEDGLIEMENVKTGERVTRKVDAVVLSVGYQPDQALVDSFSDTAPLVKTIGDAIDVKNIGMAVRSGYSTAYEI